jgi:hypothetical protein
MTTPIRWGPREYEFVRPVSVINFTTGQWMPFDGEIHKDDVDWLVWLLNKGWALDWKIAQAEETVQSCRSAPVDLAHPLAHVPDGRPHGRPDSRRVLPAETHRTAA